MAVATLIYGYIGSGKTTLARRLERERDAVRFSSDEWVAALYGAAEGAVPDFDAALRRVELIMEPVWARCLHLGLDVVLDLGFWKRAKRDHVRDTARSAGAGTELIEVITEPETAWARVERRNFALEGSVQISREAFAALRVKIEPLEPDESHTTVRT